MTVLTQQLFYREVGALAIAYARVAPVFYLLPFLNDRVIVNTVLKNTIIFVVIAGLWHAVRHPLLESSTPMLWLAVQEATAGLVLGVTLSLPFWVAAAIGEFIDNQRGATISDSIDPATGVETSVLAPFLSLFYAALFLHQGGMLLIVQAIRESYLYLPAGAIPHAHIWHFGSLLSKLVGKGIVLAAPVLLSMFLSDAMLGLFSRFCPQVNAFSLSLSIKSIVAFLVFHLYFLQVGRLVSTELFQLDRFSSLVY
ncbi:Surface presentation of antigens protein SpaR [Paraburkholderia ribeironis]|uniref:Surface presentation of antigens protein SpaR n=1 Tax=Paraburkholderia ribeironis TaxID=1247936 RepID=A0A1N7SC88_9BURK|nr:type III secretion system export apparatus subunit SctT [Paraburkholderia ribeironis]SIT44971.1 Surface presentation of antigens protein SpaR [Paraburkholderia ribeironis]